ncbi:cupin [Longibacter salinarum]|uniref:Cupin n=2 Tax=Longibacter salinarum TaxID=1850348 RepID=A0A2A8CVQ3_9BACT|nr:cupin [Longibacter salinarum]
MEVSELDSRPASVGSSEYFTGTAIIEPLFSPNEAARASAARVLFAPGARTAWHSHPRGQRLAVTSGHGWVQQRGGERRKIEPGDVVWTPPGVEHWHGATPSQSMSHIAIQEEKNGSVVEWMDPVTDDEYREGADE